MYYSWCCNYQGAEIIVAATLISTRALLSIKVHRPFMTRTRAPSSLLTTKAHQPHSKGSVIEPYQIKHMSRIQITRVTSLSLLRTSTVGFRLATVMVVKIISCQDRAQHLQYHSSQQRSIPSTTWELAPSYLSRVTISNVEACVWPSVCY